MLDDTTDPGRRRAWVALGLGLTLHPRMKRLFHPESVLSGDLLEAAPRRLQAALSLRPPRGTVIFTGDFPEWADKEIQACLNGGIRIVVYDDRAYPSGLRCLPDPPPFLYVKGTLPAPGAVAVVGSRRPSPYGLRVAERIARDLADAGVAVVSGAARGIDTAAHRGALDAGGRTIGVLGSGIDTVYPQENGRLFGEIAGSGALVTEFPLGASPKPHHFPVRNRIIAGLSQAVLVVEAARDSGSLITARLASDDLGLPVGAVPGPITSAVSEGCNDLIYDGATPVRSAADILDLLPESCRPRRRAGKAVTGDEEHHEGLDPQARRVLAALDPDTPTGADDLAGRLRLASGVLLGHLLDLEMRGLATRLPGGRFLRKG